MPEASAAAGGAGGLPSAVPDAARGTSSSTGPPPRARPRGRAGRGEGGDRSRGLRLPAPPSRGTRLDLQVPGWETTRKPPARRLDRRGHRRGRRRPRASPGRPERASECPPQGAHLRRQASRAEPSAGPRARGSGARPALAPPSGQAGSFLFRRGRRRLPPVEEPGPARARLPPPPRARRTPRPAPGGAEEAAGRRRVCPADSSGEAPPPSPAQLPRGAANPGRPRGILTSRRWHSQRRLRGGPRCLLLLSPPPGAGPARGARGPCPPALFGDAASLPAVWLHPRRLRLCRAELLTAGDAEGDEDILKSIQNHRAGLNARIQIKATHPADYHPLPQSWE